MEPSDSELARRLKGVVGESFLDDLVNGVAGTAKLSPAEVDRFYRYARVKVEGLQSLATTLDDPEDVEELHDSLVTMWIELRSEWARYNKTVNYRRLIHDEEDMFLSALGAACSNILKTIEPLIPNEIHRLTDFAAAPLPAMSRSGRFADTNVEDRKLATSSVEPLVTDLVRLIRDMQADETVAATPAWQAQLVSYGDRFERMLWEPGVPTEVAKVALEERLLRLGQRQSLPFAPRIQISGADRLDANVVAKLLESTEELFESLSGALCATEGPVRSQADFRVDGDSIRAAISVLPSFVSNENDKHQEVFDSLRARGLELDFDANTGLSLKYELERAN